MSVAGYTGSMAVGGIIGGAVGYGLTPPPTRGPIIPSLFSKITTGACGVAGEAARQKLFSNTKGQQGPSLFAGEKAGASNNNNKPKSLSNAK